MFNKRDSNHPKHRILWYQNKYNSALSKFLLSLFTILITFGLSGYSQDFSKKQDFDVFMWVGAQKLHKEDPQTLENMLLFADRHEIIPYSSGMNEPEKLNNFLSSCKKLNIPKTWIEIGPGKQVTIEEFVNDAEARQPILNRFKRLARIYKKHYPDFARITIFDEAPLGAFGMKKADKGKGYIHQLKRFMEHGPEAFSYLQKALKEEMPKAEVGIFMHHPHNASKEMAGDYSTIDEFLKQCQKLNALPDFIFSDVYRGYFNRGYGIEATNAYITDVVAHTADLAKNYAIEAYQLGQMHTIKLGYTPSKYEIDRNIEAMLAGKPDGIGWYWPNYTSTNYERQSGSEIGEPTGYDVSLDPFVPNAWGKIGPAGSIYATSKDRFVYSYLRMLEKQGKSNAKTNFDLWLYGYDFDHTEHTLYIKNRKSQWDKIAYFNPQQDKEGYEKEARKKFMYTYNNRWHALAFHALSRKNYLLTDDKGNTKVNLKIETPEGSDQSKFSAAYVMPHRPTRNYVTEQEITGFLENHPRWVEINSLVRHIRPDPKLLDPGKSVKLNGK
ncbi:MAG: hypothetical protein K9I47_10535 [Bacteroidales bacterium]|nr:hypothetical protein [Bacteroidales bacterium]